MAAGEVSILVSIIPNVSRDQAILDAAERLFYERGFDGVGVDAIGKVAGVTGSAIYRHFDSKDEILAMLFDRVIDALLAGNTVREDDPAAELRRLATNLADLARTHRQLAGIWEREQRVLADPFRRRYHRRMRSYVNQWEECLTELYPGQSAAYLRTAIRAAHVMLLSDATRPQPPSNSMTTTALLVEMCIRSLEALAEPVG